MEEAYRSSLFKSFTKTLEDGFFPVVIVDAIHDKVSLGYECSMHTFYEMPYTLYLLAEKEGQTRDIWCEVTIHDQNPKAVYCM